MHQEHKLTKYNKNYNIQNPCQENKDNKFNIYADYKVCFSISENKKLEILLKYTFTHNYNYQECSKLINLAFEQTKNCQYSDYCSLWKLNKNTKFPEFLTKKLNVKTNFNIKY